VSRRVYPGGGVQPASLFSIMSVTTAEEFALRAFDLDLLDEHQLRSVWAEIGTTSVSLQEFQNVLLGHGLLTSYQVHRLMRGERTGFFFGDYKALYQIGAGSFARAFRAVHKDTGKVVAIKALRQRYNHDPEVTGQFSREGTIGSLLRHPNIVPIYEVVSKEDEHYLVMEFIEGRTLRQFLKVRKQLEPAEAVRIMSDITAGLGCAFDLGITHRDLKASNIVITAHGEAKLLDFGLAAVSQTKRSHLIEEGPNPRAIDYVGLERLSKVKKNDPRSDIFFAGCIMYHALAGHPPLEETTDRLRRLRTDRFTGVVPLTLYEPSLPRFVTRICDTAMSLAVEDRYQKPSEMLSDLRAAAKRLGPFDDQQAAGERAAGRDERAAGLIPAVPNAAALPSTNGHAGEGPPTAEKKVVMVVESNQLMQNVFRQAFLDSGYEVLITTDPRRAVSLFDEDPRTANCILFCSSDLGEPALDAFNRFAVGTRTAHVPAVLVVGKEQNDWLRRANIAPHRIAVASPLRIRQLRELVARLMPLSE
jgi:CheY-like chemotaxis protein/predicted Ser/Thr protein kinase